MLLAALAVACSQTGQSRQSSVGGDDSETSASGTAGSGSSNNATGVVVPTPAPGSTGTSTPGTGTGTLAGSGTLPTIGTSSGSIPNTTTTLPNSESLEQCEAQDKAWIAVVNNGASPATCGNALVSWCCTRAEVEARFPTMASQLESNFKNFIDTQGEVLYACSVDASSNYTFSMAKIVNGATTYNTMTISGVFPINTNDPTNNCPAVTTPQLEKSTLMLDDE